MRCETSAPCGKTLPYKPAFEPYWGKPAVRNLRGDDGDVGIIRSPVRAIVLPDRSPVPPARSWERRCEESVYRARELFEGAALVEVDLLTGRTHQIRVHLAEAGHPLLCDALYGAGRKAKGRVAEAQEALGRQALHAWRLAFAHPRTGKALKLEAPLPADFEAAVTILRGAGTARV